MCEELNYSTRIERALLFIESNDEFAKIASFQHADESLRRILQSINEVLAIPDAAVGDAGADLLQEVREVLRCKLVVYKAAYREAL